MKELITETSVPRLFDVRGKSVFITGAGGLGAHLARGFVENGARVILSDVVPGKAAAVAESLAGAGPEPCWAYEMDQTSSASIQKTVDDIVARQGGIDVLINTAAICTNDDTPTFPEDEIRRLFDINVIGTILLDQAVARVMIEQRRGKIINIGSIGGLECHSFRSMPYEATKAAVHQVTKSFACALAEYNINVNCICPTWINTPILSFLSAEVMEAAVDQHLFGRISEVEDYLGTALFLASDASNYISGQVLAVDGCWSTARPWRVRAK